MMDSFDALEVFRDATGSSYAREYVRLKQLARNSYLNEKAKRNLEQCDGVDGTGADVPAHCKATATEKPQTLGSSPGDDAGWPSYSR